MSEVFELQAQNHSGSIEFRFEDGELSIESTATETCPQCQEACSHQVRVVLDNPRQSKRLLSFLSCVVESISSQEIENEFRKIKARLHD